MSCHTWAYRQIQEKELGKYKKVFADIIKRDGMFIPDGTKFEDYLEKEYVMLTKAYGESFITREKLSKQLKREDAKLRKGLEKLENVNDMATLAKIVEDSCDIDPEYTVVNGKLYELCDFDQPCRVYGYPEETFTDCDEFIDWLKNNDVDCVYYDREGPVEHKGFCDKMEKSIRDFWAEYDGNVYVNFG